MVQSGDRSRAIHPNCPTDDSALTHQLTTVETTHHGTNLVTSTGRFISHPGITNPLEIVAKRSKTFASFLNSDVIQRKKERENVVLTGLLFANQYLNINWTVTVS